MSLRRIADDVYLLWAVMALPALWFMVERFVLHGRVAYVPWTGILSCWLLILAMAVTPLQLLFGPLPWLKKRRRYFGVASFGYAALHLGFWALNVNLGGFLKSFIRMEILTGWIAMAIMAVLAATSFDGAVDRMGPLWKRVQRWIYPMAVLTLLHWIMTDLEGWRQIVAYCLPLVLLEAWRMIRYRRRMRRDRGTGAPG